MKKVLNNWAYYYYGNLKKQGDLAKNNYRMSVSN
jgi:hypothetical protein